MSAVIVWLKNDLRLIDNPALYYAAQSESEVLVLISLTEKKSWPNGSATNWWLHHSLESFETSLKKIGGSLFLTDQPALSTILDLKKRYPFQSVFINEGLLRSDIEEQGIVRSEIESHGLSFKSFEANLLIDRRVLKTQTETIYQVYTPFARAARLLKFSPPLPAPKKLKSPPIAGGKKLKDFNLLPKIKWDGGFKDHWQPGEMGAHKAFKVFVDQSILQYAKARDVPSLDQTSKLSPHLHFGEISARQVCHEIKSKAVGPQKFIDEIYWREFGYYLLFHFPQLSDQNLRKEFDRFGWQKNSRQLRTWQMGLTGYPIVDAGMRQLWKIGWMHNRVRMIVASFLVKDLMIHWKEGALWFWDTLVDADLASNTLGWQWAAGSGPDAAPYFRIFNPTLQSKKFDPTGEYIKRWIPELKNVSAKWIHEPWKMTPIDQAQAKIKMGHDYPLPMVNHDEARKKALAAYSQMRK
jgi:deoxyribodipyrimidine photo-lyase